MIRQVLLVGDGAARRALARVREPGLDKICLLPSKVGPDEALRAQSRSRRDGRARLDQRVCRLVTPLEPVEAMALAPCRGQ